jgi:hypothetical protein
MLSALLVPDIMVIMPQNKISSKVATICHIMHRQKNNPAGFFLSEHNE